MAKVIAICGKICSGKTYYANTVKQKENAVALSCDEISRYLFNNDLGNNHDEMSKKIRDYLLKKATDIVEIGTNVVLDWGFWTKAERASTSDFFKEKNIVCEWHYIKIDDISWRKNINERNERILRKENCSDYYLDEGLMQKLSNLWEEPASDEIDVEREVKR